MRRDIGVALGVLIADQLTKYLAILLFDGHVVSITSFFNLRLSYNTGVSFSFFNTWPVPALLFLMLLVLIFVIVLYVKSKIPLEKTAYALIMAGALSNAYDRLTRKGVVDFLDFHAKGYHWPTFNIADSAIVLSCGLILWSGLILKKA